MELGLRVVRGPDWKWQNQDGGEGHVGTVVEIGKPGTSNTPVKTAVIQWDSGYRTNYRVGYQDSYDLRIFDNAPVGVKHPNIICDACKKQGIQGFRWKCAKCYDFDLCHTCYMNDKHDHSHPFIRFDTVSSSGIKVGKRIGSAKLQAKGIFAGAKVVRGSDWDWGNQDGGEGKSGRVIDIRGWDSESGRSVANVTWASGSTNVYRVGHKGKVDLKYEVEDTGGYYYKDHLPVLGETCEPSPDSSTQSLFKVGDKVRVDLEVDILKAMQEGHGGWNPRMAEYIGRVGHVHRITERGDVRVQFEGASNRWTFHTGALTKVQQFACGDIVRIGDNIQTIRDLQKGHGEWTDNMRTALGKVGKVLKVYADGDLRVSVLSQTWTFNPACCSILPHGQQDMNNTMGHHEREERSNDSLASLLDELLDMRSSETSTAEPEMLVREAAQGHTEVVAEIIKKHADQIDSKSSGKTALHVSSHQGHMDIVVMLLAAGADVEAADDDGDRALHYSAFGNKPVVTKFLLEKGASINAVNNSGCSTLHVAVNKQHLKCVLVLKQYGADVNVQDSYGDTALHDAIGKNSKEIVELLIGFTSIDLSLRNRRGFNVLHHTALKGNEHATEKILQRGRQIVDIAKDDGFAALHLASLNGHLEVAKTLLAVGKADIEITNNRRQTPLLLAVSQGYAALVELLISKGADASVQDEDGDTCLHLALTRQAPPVGVDNTASIVEVEKQLHEMDLDDQPSMSVACYLISKNTELLKCKNQHGKTPLDLITDPRSIDTLIRFASKYQLSSPAEDVTDSPVQECMVCSDVLAEVTFEPCGHKVVCETCCLKIKKCFVCQTVIIKKVSPDGKNVFVDKPVKRTENIGNEELEHLRRKMQEMEDTLNCSICMENPRTMAFMCGHSACTPCSSTLKICHMCRKPIQRKIPLFS